MCVDIAHPKSTVVTRVLDYRRVEVLRLEAGHALQALQRHSALLPAAQNGQHQMVSISINMTRQLLDGTWGQPPATTRTKQGDRSTCYLGQGAQGVSGPTSADSGAPCSVEGMADTRALLLRSGSTE